MRLRKECFWRKRGNMEDIKKNLHNDNDMVATSAPFKFRAVWPIIRAAGLVRWTMMFVFLFLATTIIVSAAEPDMGGLGNSAWLMFQVVTTIGLGDFTPVSIAGRVTTVILSTYSVLFFALVTGAVVSYCQERLKARQNESVAQFIDRLEHLPELSHEELVDLSEQVKRIHHGKAGI